MLSFLSGGIQDGRSHYLFSGIDHDKLSRGRSALFSGKRNRERIPAYLDGCRFVRLAIPELDGRFRRKGETRDDLLPLFSDALGMIELQRGLGTHSNGIFVGIFPDDKECRPSSDVDPFALPDSIEMGAFMGSQEIPINMENVSRFFWEAFLEKPLHADFPNETQPLTILSLRVWKSGIPGEFPYFCLFQSSYRKKRVGQLILGKAGKEIALVLFRIEPFEQMKTLAILPDAGIVAHGDFVVSELPCLLGKKVEFDEIVAEHVGIRGNTPFVSGIDVLDDPLLVGFPVIEGKKWNIEILCHLSGDFDILPRGTRSRICQIIDHEAGMDFVSCLLE